MQGKGARLLEQWYGNVSQFIMLGADALFTQVVFVALISLAFLCGTHYLRQPPLLAYILTGLVAGPFALGLIADHALVQAIGEFGLVLLLFFIGMEMDLGLLLRTWRKVVTSTGLQILFGILSVAVVGYLLSWNVARVVLLGFVISLSSTAIVLRYLESRKLMSTTIGSYVCGILFTQDMAVGPMLIVLALLAGTFAPLLILKQTIGLILLFCIFYILWTHRFPAVAALVRFLKNREHALFFNIAVGFGMSAIANVFGLSVGIGAFLAGMLAARHYAHKRILTQLESIKTLLVAIFFMSIGALIDMQFFFAHAGLVLLLVMVVFLANTLAYTAIFVSLRVPFRQSMYMAALLAQIGEFSFFIALGGYELGVIGAYGYQLTVLVIALTLLLSPLWIALFRRLEPGRGVVQSPRVPQRLCVRTPYRWAW